MNFERSIEYRKAIHDLIPGGAHTYTKGDDQFPLNAPAAIKRGAGAYIWDLDDNKYLDCSMGLTSVVLGHVYAPVIDRIIDELGKGVNFQRPSYLEREVAEEFLELVPQHDMIKFAKNGSSTTTAAVKLARSKTGRNIIAFPIEHPFFSYDDWFIGATDCNRGVPEEIQALSKRFHFNDIEALKQLFLDYPGKIACIISEPHIDGVTDVPYLKQAIDLAHENGAVYILDEMITGFKAAFPGLVVEHGLEPDISTWGKSIANGFSFCCMTGKKEIMELGGITNDGEEKVFLVSTTHGGETHTLAACQATMKVFKENEVISHNHGIGKYFREQCLLVIEDTGLKDSISLNTSDWWPMMDFRDGDGNSSMGFKTLMEQEMIGRGVLFTGFLVSSFSHTNEDIDFFVAQFKESLEVYKIALDEGYESYLEGPVIKPVFRKYI